MMTTQTSQQQKTPLYDNHVRRGARMVDFAGWQMPLQYSKVLDEHNAVRTAAGLFDISHMGLVVVRSGDVDTTRRFLDSLVPQDLTKLYPGKAVYTQFLNQTGGIIDDIIVYMLPQSLELSGFEEFLVICNASNVSLDMEWIRSHAPENVKIEFLSERYSLFALQGPKFAEVLATGGVSVESLPKRFHIGPANIKLQGGAMAPVLFARTGYTGEDGVEIIVRQADAEPLWDSLLDYATPIGGLPIGLGARDTLRLEAAYPLHGHDISEEDSPLEAGLGWSVKLDAEGSFIGKPALLRQKEKGLVKSLYCFKLNKKTIPRQHDIILKDGAPVGEVTSGSISPTLNLPVGMGYIQAGRVSGPGDTIQIRIRGMDVDAEIVEKPFYKAR